MYRRVLLKLSGEALAAPDFPFSTETLEKIALQVKEIREMGIDIGIVIGGGELVGAVLVRRHKITPVVTEARDHRRGSVVSDALAVHRIDKALIQYILDLDVAHRLFVVLFAAHGLKHIGMYPGVGPADGQSQEQHNGLERNTDIEKAGQKKPDAFQQSACDLTHNLPPWETRLLPDSCPLSGKSA